MNKRNIDFGRFNSDRQSMHGGNLSKADENCECWILKNFGDSPERTEIDPNAESPTYEYLYAEDVAKLLNIGRSKAYEMISEVNKLLETQGKYVLPGRVPKKLFMEQLY